MHSFGEVIEALRRLKNDPELRHAMTANGLKRGKESDPARTTKRWQEFFEQVAVPAYEKVRNESSCQREFHRWNGVLKTKAHDWRERLWH